MPELQTFVFKVGMHCEGCRRKVKNALCDIPGVEELKVDFKEQKVTIRGNVDVKTVTKKLAKTGKVNHILVPPAATATTTVTITTASNNQKTTTPEPIPPAPATTSPSITKEAILKDLQLAPPVVWMENPYLLSDENPNACSIM